MPRSIRVLLLILLAYQGGCAARVPGSPTGAPSAVSDTGGTPQRVETVNGSTPAATPGENRPRLSLLSLREWTIASPIPWTRPTWSPRGPSFALATLDGIEMFDAQSLERVWSSPPIARAYYASSIAHDAPGKRILSYSELRGLQVWDPDSGRLLTEWPERAVDPTCSMWWSYDLLQVAGGRESLAVPWGEDRYANLITRIDIWDNSSGNCIRNLVSMDGMPSSVDLSPDGNAIALGTVSGPWGHLEWQPTQKDGRLAVWDVQSGRLRCEIPALEGAFRPSNGLLLVQMLDDKSLTYWDIDRCEPVSTMPWGQEVYEIAFSPGGEFLAVRRESLWILDSETGLELAEVPDLVPPDIAASFGLNEGGIAFSRQGSFLASFMPAAVSDFSLRIWALRSY